MEEKIENSIQTIEDALEEIKITLRMSDTNLYSFTSYRKGNVDKPPYLNQWAEEGVIGEFENIIKAITTLDEVKKELKTYLNKKEEAA